VPASRSTSPRSSSSPPRSHPPAAALSYVALQGLAERRSFGGAHLQVLQNDATPDVPLRTSDFYLEELLRERAAEAGKSFEALVDELLAEAWRDKASWEPGSACSTRSGGISDPSARVRWRS